MLPKYPIRFVIPAYNCTETVHEAVQSILNGNFESSDEIILVNDSSTDNTADILASLQAQCSVIRIVLSAPCGGGLSRG
jgi:glycosyltransferase involved in cell wall biosynthesis